MDKETEIKPIIEKGQIIPVIPGLLLLVSLFTLILIKLTIGAAFNAVPATVVGGFFYFSLTYFIVERQDWARRDKNAILVIFVFAYCLRLVAAYVVYPYFVLHNLNPDQWVYVEFGKKLAHIWDWGDNPFSLIVFQLQRWGHLGIYIVVALHYKVIQSEFFFFCTNVFLGVYCIVPMYRIAIGVLGEKGRNIALTAIFVYAIFPISIFWSSWILKEMICVFMCIMFIDKLIQYLHGRLAGPLIWMFVILAVTSTIRLYLAPLFVATAGIVFLLQPGKSKKVVVVTVGSFVLLVMLIVVQMNVLLKTPAFAPLMGYLVGAVAEGGFSTASESRSSFSKEGSSDVQGTQYTSPAAMVLAFPVGLLRTLTTPVRWFRDDQTMIEKISVYNIVFWYLLLPFALIGFIEWFFKHFRPGAAVTVFLVLLILVFSVINMGGTFRQNNMFYPFFCLFVAMGMFRANRMMPIVMSLFILLGLLVTRVEFASKMTLQLIFPSLAISGLVILYTLWVEERKKARS